jgi:hypothetical protein
MALTKVGKEGITGISNASDATAITITSAEKVGIGESAPQSELHIKTADASATAQSGSALVIEGTDATRADLQFLGDAGAFQAIYFGDNSDADIGRIAYDHTGNSMRFTVNAAERLRIESGGSVIFRKTSSDDTVEGTTISNRLNQTTDGGVVLLLNRHTDDGTIVLLRQNNQTEGEISVSGSTVSFNGGHLSRWSQLSDNTRDNTLVKGTVMTNLDQMAEWTTDGVTEDNEQLNCMAVSSVEGDANVAGVFVNWDNDDDVYTNDMNVAMTGDMVIRIAQGTTVARGDLLMSAGDGTAKSQGDDIVRSKTIAKVTSTNKSHTYDDGTYLVPCVLMAC